MSTETRPHIEKTYPFRLESVLNRAYDHFEMDEAVNVGTIYSGIDSEVKVQVGMNGINPLLAAFSLSLRGDSADQSEHRYFNEGSHVLLDPFKGFEGRSVHDLIPLSWLAHSTRDRGLSRFMKLPALQEVARFAAKEKSIGLFYEHLAGIVDLDGESEPIGFNNAEAGYYELLTADLLHNRGRSLITGFIRDSRLIDPPPARFDRDFETIERFREEERDRWGVVISGDLSAMEAWQRFLDRGIGGERGRNAALAVNKYAKAISDVERLKDISARQAREALNPFQAL